MLQTAKSVILCLFYLLLLMLCAFFLYKLFEYKDALIAIAENGIARKTESAVVNFVVANMRECLTCAIIAAIAFGAMVCISGFASMRKKHRNGLLLILLFLITAGMAIAAFISIKKIEGRYFLKSRYTHYYFGITGIFILLSTALFIIYLSNYLKHKKNISYDKQFHKP